MFSFMLVYAVGMTYGRYYRLLDSWEEVVMTCREFPPNSIPEFNAYVIFRSRKGEEYRLLNVWNMLAGSGDLEMVRSATLGVSSLTCTFVPLLEDGFGQLSNPYPYLRDQATQGTAPVKLSGILEQFVSGLEGKRMETQEPEYVPTEEEKKRWEAYREAIRYGLFSDGQTDDGAQAEKESA